MELDPALDLAPRPLAGPVRLGAIVVAPPLFLAPMAGFTNLPFRRILKRLGCGFTTTEMVMAEGVVRGHPRTLELAQLAPEERPAAVQLAGGEPETLAAAAARLVDEGRADAIDVNMGCPVRRIVDQRAGAALLKDPARAARIVGAIRRRVPVAVTVKIRAGWDDASQCIALARAAEAAGAAGIAVHGRTREQQYAGRSDLDAIAAVKEAVGVPVIGNGDVARPEDAAEMVRATGVDGVMIGRAALRDPWIFEAAARALAGEPRPPLASPAERRALLLEYFEETAARQGEHRTALQMRRFAGAYLRGFAGARRIRERIPTLCTRSDFEALVDEIFG